MTIEAWGLVFQGLALIPAYVGMALIWHGIRVMDRNATMRAADSERKHAETMAALADNREALLKLIERTGG